jgi:hypothetical protein
MHHPVYSVALGSVHLYEPVTYLTNLVLAMCCFYWAHVLRTGRSVRERAFVYFFFCMGVSMFLGGLSHLLYGYFEYYTWRRPAWLFTGFAVFAAQMGVIEQANKNWHRNLTIMALLQLMAYSALIIFDCHFIWVKINATIGITGVVILSQAYLWLARREPHAGKMALGFSLNILALPIHGLQLGLHPVYFNHNDVAHVLMILCFYLVFLGARPLRAPSMEADLQEDVILVPQEVKE